MTTSGIAAERAGLGLWIALGLLAPGCSSSESPIIWDPLPAQPGSFLAEGGELRHENVRYLGQPVQTWLTVYQYTASPAVPTAPFGAPVDGGTGKFGDCVDERSGSPTWPFRPITGATYLALPTVALSGPGITGSLDIARTEPPSTTGNSTFRTYDFTYGGGAPGDPPSGFNGTLTAAMSAPGGDYTLDIGKGDPMTYHMPEAVTAPLGLGGADTVVIPAHRDLALTWKAPPNDKGANGTTITKQTYATTMLFVDPAASNPPQFLCLPQTDGHLVIPAAVVDALPPTGRIYFQDVTHFMERREAAPGEQRRFDLVSTFASVSAYAKQ